MALEVFPHPVPCPVFALQMGSSAAAPQQCSQRPSRAVQGDRAGFHAGCGQLVQLECC